MTAKFKELIAEHRDPRPHVMVNAKAGTGKTFTLVLGVAWAWRDKVWKEVERKLGKIVPSDEQQEVWDAIDECHPTKVTYVAFNNSIVKEFESKWNWMAKCLERVGCILKFSTIHSLGYQACKKEYKLGYKGVNKFTTTDNLCELLNADLSELRKHHREVLNATVDLVSKAKLNLLGEEDRPPLNDASLAMLASHYGVDTNGEDEKVFGYVKDLLNWAKERKGTYKINFDDQIWLPVVNKLIVPKSDLMLVDESQDLNPCQQGLVDRASARLIFCGDPNQAIYGFAGADTQSMSNLESKLKDSTRGVNIKKLTMTRRCGKNIVMEAQKIVPDFYAHETCPEGKITRLAQDKAFELYGPDDLVLCRTNAPLLGQAFKMLKAKRPARMQGKDQLAGALRSLIKKSNANFPEDLILWAHDWEVKEIAKIKKRRHYDEESIMVVSDKADCLCMLAEESESMEQMEQLLGQVFDFEPPVTLFSSIHRAKGLEANRVFILKPELLPHPMAESEWAREQESNLEYVAITRAIHELIYVQSANSK